MGADKRARLIPWEAIKVDESFNARQRYDGIGELAANIRQRGLITPLEVEETSPGVYELRCGFRRWRAMSALRAETPRGKAKPFAKVPVRLFTGNQLDSFLHNLAENGGRRDLRLWEMGARCIELRETFKLDAGEIAQRIGVSKSYMYSAIKVTTLAAPILAHCKKADIPTDYLIRWASKSPEQQIKEFQAWQQQNEHKAPQQRGTRTPQPLRLAKERATQAPILLRAIREARKPKAWKDGALAAVKWMAGQTARPPVPLSPRS